jgi:hypothetical protein
MITDSTITGNFPALGADNNVILFKFPKYMRLHCFCVLEFPWALSTYWYTGTDFSMNKTDPYKLLPYEPRTANG